MKIFLIPRALKSLPREGINAVFVGGCYGETAQDCLKDVPPGAYLNALNGRKVVGWSDDELEFAKASNGKTSPADLLLAALATTDPMENAKKAQNKNLTNNAKLDTDPNDVLPHTIGVGGHPPIKLDLNLEMKDIASKGESLNAAAYQASIDKVKEVFDARLPPPSGIVDTKGILNKEISEVADKVKNGKKLDGPQEQRIGYALTVTYLEKSGELQRLTEVTKGKVHAKAPDKKEPEKQGADAPHVSADITFVGHIQTA